MPSLDKIAFTSALEVDKIVDTLTGSFTITNNNASITTIPHSFGRKLFSELQWSIDNSNFYPSSYSIKVGGGEVTVVGSVDASDVRFYTENFSTGATRTIHYRMILIWRT